MKARILNILLLSIISISAHANTSQEQQIEALVQGNYFLIGKAIGNKNTYYGQVSIVKTKSGLEVTRTIGGKATIGTAAVEHATSDKVPVLRIRFNQNNKNHEATCMVGSDLDNFARITCHVYMPGINSMEPGMEALFINYNKPW